MDPERTHLNLEYCNESIKQVYHKLFDEALERYNAKQTRSDRRIDNYYEKICTGKQERPFHELIIQIGNRDDTGSGTEIGEQAKAALEDQNLSAAGSRLAAGTITQSDYDARVPAAENARLSAESADLALFSAMETYDWNVNGLAAAE